LNQLVLETATENGLLLCLEMVWSKGCQHSNRTRLACCLYSNWYPRV